MLEKYVGGRFRYERDGEHIADDFSIIISLEELRSPFLSYSVKIYKISKVLWSRITI
jgi:hypothetical protein